MNRECFIQLPSYWDGCPEFWKNFVIDSRKTTDTAEYVFKRLKHEYNAVATKDSIYKSGIMIRGIMFDNEVDLLAFKLRWL